LYFRKLNIKLTTIKWQFYQKIRQRSALMIAVIAFALFAFIIGDLFKSGGFDSTSKDVGSINEKIFHLRILELK
jgi:peptidyl-prolyl cis-trans isomerase D